MCQNLALTARYVPASGPDCRICAEFANPYQVDDSQLKTLELHAKLQSLLQADFRSFKPSTLNVIPLYYIRHLYYPCNVIEL